MLKYLLIMLSAGLLVLTGCGNAPEPATDGDQNVEPVEEVETVVVYPAADPGNLVEYRGQDGEELFFFVTGDDMGSVWGTDVYTDDSYLSTAAVHSGVLENGESGVVMVTIMPGQDSYEGSVMNGVESWDYGIWSGSYKVEALPENYEVGAMEDPGNLVDYREYTGESFEFTVTGDSWGSIWGTDIYTDDSNLATAAVHAGVLAEGETGVVTVTILPGQESYTGSERNGVESWDYGEWSGSYSVE